MWARPKGLRQAAETTGGSCVARGSRDKGLSSEVTRSRGKVPASDRCDGDGRGAAIRQNLCGVDGKVRSACHQRNKRASRLPRSKQTPASTDWPVFSSASLADGRAVESQNTTEGPATLRKPATNRRHRRRLRCSGATTVPRKHAVQSC